MWGAELNQARQFQQVARRHPAYLGQLVNGVGFRIYMRIVLDL
jgi:hypothetical protein